MTPMPFLTKICSAIGRTPIGLHYTNSQPIPIRCILPVPDESIPAPQSVILYV